MTVTPQPALVAGLTFEQTLTANTKQLNQVLAFAVEKFTAMTKVLLHQERELDTFRQMEQHMLADTITPELLSSLLNKLQEDRAAFSAANPMPSLPQE